MYWFWGIAEKLTQNSTCLQQIRYIHDFSNKKSHDYQYNDWDYDYQYYDLDFCRVFFGKSIKNLIKKLTKNEQMLALGQSTDVNLNQYAQNLYDISDNKSKANLKIVYQTIINIYSVVLLDYKYNHNMNWEDHSLNQFMWALYKMAVQKNNLIPNKLYQQEQEFFKIDPASEPEKIFKPEDQAYFENLKNNLLNYNNFNQMVKFHCVQSNQKTALYPEDFFYIFFAENLQNFKSALLQEISIKLPLKAKTLYAIASKQNQALLKQTYQAIIEYFVKLLPDKNKVAKQPYSVFTPMFYPLNQLMWETAKKVMDENYIVTGDYKQFFNNQYWPYFEQVENLLIKDEGFINVIKLYYQTLDTEKNLPCYPADFFQTIFGRNIKHVKNKLKKEALQSIAN